MEQDGVNREARPIRPRLDGDRGRRGRDFPRRLLVLTGWGLLGLPVLYMGVSSALCLLSRCVPLPFLARGARPSLTVDAAERDFGTIPLGTVLEHRFRLTNSGGRPLVVRRVIPCCGLTATLEGEPRLNPGDSRTVKVASGSLLTPGREERVIEVLTDDPTKPKIPLKISWNLIPTLAILPSSVDVGEVRRGERVTRVVDLMPTSRDFRILATESTSPALRVKLPVLPENAAYSRIEIEMASEVIAPGEFRGEVRIRTTAAPYSWMTIPVQATIVEEFEIRPPRLFLGFVGPRSDKVVRATIIARSSKVPPVTLSSGSVGRFRLALRPETGGRCYELTAAPKGRLPTGRVEETVELRVGDRTLRVPLSGYVEPSLD